jgi:putative phosphoesterase
MKIGIISDTHGDVRATRRAVQILQRQGVGVLIHCGDVGLEILPCLNEIPAHVVSGNMDHPELLQQALAETKHTFHDQFGTLEIEGVRLAFLHGHDVKLLYHSIHSGQWDLVIHGHTHAFSQRVEGQTVVLNAGALARTLRPSVAVVELPSLEITEIAL